MSIHNFKSVDTSIGKNMNINHWRRRPIYLSSFKIIEKENLVNLFLGFDFQISLGCRSRLRTLLWSGFFEENKRSRRSGWFIRKWLRNGVFISFPFTNSSYKEIRIRGESTWYKKKFSFCFLKRILKKSFFLPLTILCVRDANRGRVRRGHNNWFIIWYGDRIPKLFYYKRTKAFWWSLRNKFRYGRGKGCNLRWKYLKWSNVLDSFWWIIFIARGIIGKRF